MIETLSLFRPLNQKLIALLKNLSRSEWGKKVNRACQASVRIPAGISWKLFTKAVQFKEVQSVISIEGEERLALPSLQMVTVMA